jgi:G1/S-specific cyclin PLC1
MVAFPYDTDLAWDLDGLSITPSMMVYLAQKATAVVPRMSCPDSSVNWANVPSIYRFIKSVVTGTKVPVPTLATSLVYMWRLQQRLPLDAWGLPCTPHRIFLAALNLAAKNVHDEAPRNRFWSEHSYVAGYDSFGFSTKEVNLMERQLLHVLNWNVRIDTLDFVHQLAPLLIFVGIHPFPPHEPPLKVKCERKARKRRYSSLVSDSQDFKVANVTSAANA